MKTYPGKRKTVIFTKAQVKDLLNYFWRDQRISKASSSTYLRIILRNNLKAKFANHKNCSVWETLA